MKLKMIISVFVLMIIVLLFHVMDNMLMGKTPEALAVRVSSSSQYNKERQEFQNRRPDVIREMDANLSKEFSMGEFIVGMFIDKNNKIPKHKLPEVKPDMAEFLKPSEKAKIIWLGHSSLIMNIDSKIVLIDPMLSNYSSPVPLFVKRFQPPVLAIKELPKIDYVIISHDHYDHLDKNVIKHFKGTDTKFITPLKVGNYLRRWGIDNKNITELDWWGNTKLDNNIELVATPAQHFSGRSFKRSPTLWASWVIKGKSQKIFFSSDSGYDTHFKTIGEKYGPFDIALMEDGQYNKAWKQVHMMPEELGQAYFDIKAKAFVPIHWGMFTISIHSWDDPIKSIYKIAQERKINLLTPKIGETFTIGEDFKSSEWWNN